jgi:hypothetical protein
MTLLEGPVRAPARGIDRILNEGTIVGPPE